jgi:cytochrome P450
MDNYDVSHDENIFPSSFSYTPERWLNNPKAPDGKQLSRYMVSFGRGTRSCVGMQLAYAEIYIALASFFRRVGATLHETNRTDVDLARDCFAPRPYKGSLGVRVLIE